MTDIPAGFLDLLQEKKAFANLATVMPDGSPQVTPVWFDYTNGKIRINSARGRVKAKTLKEGARVALAILDPENPYRYLEVRGKVEEITQDGAAQHIDKMAKKYLGKDKYPFAQPGEQRVLLKVTPEKFSAMG